MNDRPAAACFARLALTAGAALLCGSGAPRAEPDDAALARWKAWRADLDYLYQKIEEPDSLREILEAKGIEWKSVVKETDKRFQTALAAVKKRRKDDARADEVEFYGILRGLIGQLRDSHARLEVEEGIFEAWKASQSPRYDAGIELQPGTHGSVLVSNTFAARNAVSPLRGRGVMHDATRLESVDGVPAGEYFEKLARRMYEEEGWQSTLGRARIEAMNGLQVPEDGQLELVFQTLEVSEKDAREYLALSREKRAKGFPKLAWKEKKLTLRASECTQARNARNFFFLVLEPPPLESTSDAGVRYGRLASGQGYVVYRSVSSGSRKALEEACKALADCPGLVLDMRLNGGGGESGIEVFDERVGLWNKPLAVLIGPKAMSAAETELWSLLQLREQCHCRLRSFGRTTAGASGDKTHFELPSGFAKGLFVHRHWHGGRSRIEGAGIDPDDVVDQDLVELSLKIDSCLRRAEEWLAGQR